MKLENFFMKMKKLAAKKHNEMQKTNPTLKYQQSNGSILIKKPQKITVDSFGNFIKKD
jgi:hypothetical protein